MQVLRRRHTQPGRMLAYSLKYRLKAETAGSLDGGFASLNEPSLVAPCLAETHPARQRHAQHIPPGLEGAISCEEPKKNAARPLGENPGGARKSKHSLAVTPGFCPHTQQRTQ